MKEFAERLKKIRREQGYTQQQLADLLGISKSAISMYENGVREPELSFIQKMAGIFGVDTDALIGLATPPAEDAPISPFRNMEKLIARNGKQLTEEERNKLIKLLSDTGL